MTSTRIHWTMELLSLLSGCVQQKILWQWSSWLGSSASWVQLPLSSWGRVWSRWEWSSKQVILMVNDKGFLQRRHFREDCGKVQWPNYHFSTSLSHSVGRLYANYNGLLDKFAAFWALVAQTFVERDVVIGYELMNEPWCGDIFEDPTLLFPGKRPSNVIFLYLISKCRNSR